MRVGLLVNPAAGGGRSQVRAREAAELFSEHEVVRRTTEPRVGVGRVALDLAGEVDVLAPVGGDGTLREVVEALAGEPVGPPLIPVPGGRGNSTVAHLYGADGWRRAARGLGPDPSTRPLDAGRLAGEGWGPRVFVLGASLGLLAEAVASSDRFPLARAPRGYLLATAWSWLTGGSTEVTVRVDGTRLHEGPARLVALAGGRFRGGDVPLFPEASLADGRLEALVLEAEAPWRVPALAAAVRRGDHVERAGVRHARGTDVTVRRDAAGAWELDGTLFQGVPGRVEAEVVPGAADVVVAPQKGDGVAGETVS